MDKWLVFRLEKSVKVQVNAIDHPEGLTYAAYKEPEYEMGTMDCFELIHENEDGEGLSGWSVAAHFAAKYSGDHGLRTVVIKGSVFGG